MMSEDFAKRIYDLMNEYGCYTIRDAALKTGVAYSTMSRICLHGIAPKPQILMRLADSFGVSVDYLLLRTDNDTIYPASAPVSFAERLGGLMKENGITAHRLSEEIGLGSDRVSHWLKRGYLPTTDTLIVLADRFGVCTDYLLGRTDER